MHSSIQLDVFLCLQPPGYSEARSNEVDLGIVYTSLALASEYPGGCNLARQRDTTIFQNYINTFEFNPMTLANGSITLKLVINCRLPYFEKLEHGFILG